MATSSAARFTALETAEAPDRVVRAPEGNSQTPLVRVLVAFLVLNAAFLGVLAVQLHGAQAEAAQFKRQLAGPLHMLNAFYAFASDAQERLFNGGAPALVDALISSDFGALAGNVSAFAGRVHAATCDQLSDPNLPSIADYAGEVASIASTFKDVKKLRPALEPADGGLMYVISLYNCGRATYNSCTNQPA